MQEVEYKIIDQRKNKCNCGPYDTCFCDEDLVSCDSCGCYFELIIIKYYVKFSANDRFYICEKCVDTSNYIIKKHKEVLGGQGLNE